MPATNNPLAGSNPALFTNNINKFKYENITIFFWWNTIYDAHISDTVSLMTIKPAIPKSTVIKTFKDYEVYDVDDFVKGWVKKGFIVKSICLASRPTDRDCIVVLEKY